MSDPGKQAFGKKTPAPAGTPPRKRSTQAALLGMAGPQGGRVMLMAGAGAAALGVWALSPSRSCDGRVYSSVEQCIAARTFTEGQCRSTFAVNSGAAGLLMAGNSDSGPTATPLRGGAGRWTRLDGSSLEESKLCRRGSSSGSSSSSSSGGRSSFYGGSSDSGSSSSSSSSSAGHAAAVSRGGFGSSGMHFSGGGG